jgi:hypothetical protein
VIAHPSVATLSTKKHGTKSRTRRMEDTLTADAFPAGAAAPNGSQEVPPTGGADAPNSALYVGDLDKDLNETDLYDLFNEVRFCRVSRLCVRGVCLRLWCAGSRLTLLSS